MRLSVILFSIILSSCASTQTIRYQAVPVIVPAKDFTGTVKLNSILQCPRPVQIEVYQHLKSRDDYIETLLSVIDIHNGGGNE